MSSLSDNSIFIGSKAKAIFELESNNPGYKVVSVDKLESQIKSYSKFFDNDKLFLVLNPNTEEIKIISALNNNQYHLFFDDESFDGRNGFISKIKKSGKIFDYSYPVYGDNQLLRRNITHECKRLEITVDADCYNWLLSNCPTLTVKSKTEGSKKEKIVYDLDLLFQELNKIGSIKDCLTMSDFEDSPFNVDTDIFSFIDDVLNKNKENSFYKLDYLVNKMGEQAVLLIFLSQLFFLLYLSGAKNKYSYNIDKIIEDLDMKDIVNKYLDYDWETLSKDCKHTNPIRVKIQLNKGLISEESLSKMITCITDTIADLRNSGSKDQALFILMNKLISV